MVGTIKRKRSEEDGQVGPSGLQAPPAKKLALDAPAAIEKTEEKIRLEEAEQTRAEKLALGREIAKTRKEGRLNKDDKTRRFTRPPLPGIERNIFSAERIAWRLSVDKENGYKELVTKILENHPEAIETIGPLFDAAEVQSKIEIGKPYYPPNFNEDIINVWNYMHGKGDMYLVTPRASVPRDQWEHPFAYYMIEGMSMAISGMSYNAWDIDGPAEVPWQTRKSAAQALVKVGDIVCNLQTKFARQVRSHLESDLVDMNDVRDQLYISMNLLELVSCMTPEERRELALSTNDVVDLEPSLETYVLHTDKYEVVDKLPRTNIDQRTFMTKLESLIATGREFKIFENLEKSRSKLQRALDGGATEATTDQRM